MQEILSGAFASKEEHRNDKFSKHSLDVPARLNGIMATMICPANEVDVAKYTHQTKHFVRETAALYTTATEPFVRALAVRGALLPADEKKLRKHLLTLARIT